MSTAIDVYRDWLGITETARPLNYYQLLRLKQFEDDPARIRSIYRQFNAHVRKYSTGEYGARSQELLNELAKAMLCLTDSQRKAEYDAALGRKEGQEGRARTLEEVLVGRKVIDSAQLDKARRYAKTVGIDIRDAVMQQKLAPHDKVMQAYAESIGLSYVDLNDVGLDEQLIPQVPAVMARQHSCAPLMVDDRQLLVVSTNPLSPEVEDQLRLRFSMPVRTVLCTPAGIHAAIAKYYPKEAAAAQLSARPGKAAPKAIGTSDGAVSARTATAPVDRAELVKRKRMMAILAFNFSLMGYIVLATFVMKWPWVYPPAIAIGLVAAAIAWLVTS